MDGHKKKNPEGHQGIEQHSSQNKTQGDAVDYSYADGSPTHPARDRPQPSTPSGGIGHICKHETLSRAAV